MDRAAKYRRRSLERAKAAIERLKGSPLVAIADKLQMLVSSAENTEALSNDAIQTVTAFVDTCATALPKTFGDRFAFDAALIRSVTQTWGDGRVLSSFIVPTYHSEWGHTSLPMPTEVGRQSLSEETQTHVVDLILMPGEDEVDDINLLEYAWIVHEIGHHLLFRSDPPFIDAIEDALAELERNSMVAFLPDRGRLALRSRNLAAELLQCWQPTPDHHNWSHELAADLVALWVLGPAYLETFSEFLCSQQPDPYRLDQIHPPYSLRVDALVGAGTVLGLKMFTRNLKRASDMLQRKFRSRKSNRLIRLSDKTLIDAVRVNTFQLLERLGITRCSGDEIKRLDATISETSSLEFGIELLIRARLVRLRDDIDYDKWHEKVITELVA